MPDICTTQQFFKCFAPELFHENTTTDIMRCKRACKPPCSYYQYEKAISYAHFPSEQTRFFVKDDSEWESLKNTIILEVFYTSLEVTMIKHVVAMTPSGFLAQLGGQISLWIGGSIISLFQLLFYLCYLPCRRAWRRKTIRQESSMRSRRSHSATVDDVDLHDQDVRRRLSTFARV